MRTIFLWTIATLVLCIVSFQYAWAQTAAPSDAEALRELYGAIVNGRWGWLAGLALIGAVEPLKRFLLRWRWLNSDIGGLVLVFIVAAIAGVSHALVSGAAWTPDLAVAILRNAVVAIGGYTAITRTLKRFPILERLFQPLPKPKPAPSVVSGETESR